MPTEQKRIDEMGCGRWPVSSDDYRIHAVGTRTGEVYETGKDGVFGVATFNPNTFEGMYLRRPSLVIVQHDDGAITYFEGDRVEWTQLRRWDAPEAAPRTMGFADPADYQ